MLAPGRVRVKRSERDEYRCHVTQVDHPDPLLQRGSRCLGVTLASLPRQVPGFDTVEFLVIDDGSRDRTAEVARRGGAHHIVSLPHNQGLARAFMAGIEASLKAGADVIVNTDADNQYSSSSIPDLVAPILDGSAQIVIGARPISGIDDFSPIKKLLQRLGSAVVRLASGTSIPDAPSGFRAMHRDAALRLYVFNQYTYTLETIIQAGRKNIPLMSVPVAVNRGDPAVAAGEEHSVVRRPVNRHHRTDLRAVQAPAILHGRGHCDTRARTASGSAVPRLLPHGRRIRSHPVADPRGDPHSHGGRGVCGRTPLRPDCRESAAAGGDSDAAVAGGSVE